MVDEFKELLDKCQREDSFERLLARARNSQRRVERGECFCDEATGRCNDPILFANTSDRAGIPAYDNLQQPSSQTPTENYHQ